MFYLQPQQKYFPRNTGVFQVSKGCNAEKLEETSNFLQLQNWTAQPSAPWNTVQGKYLSICREQLVSLLQLLQSRSAGAGLSLKQPSRRRAWHSTALHGQGLKEAPWALCLAQDTLCSPALSTALLMQLQALQRPLGEDLLGHQGQLAPRYFQHPVGLWLCVLHHYLWSSCITERFSIVYRTAYWANQSWGGKTMNRPETVQRALQVLPGQENASHTFQRL